MQVAVTIITLNEEKNIARAIQSVRWAQDVLVVDSGSTDRTVEIARALGVRVVHNPWPGYGKQKNFAQENALHDWVLNIDADEEVSEALQKEIVSTLKSATHASPQPVAFAFPRKTFYLGRWIRYGGWYPNTRVRLAHRAHAKWTEPHVHEDLVVSGPVAHLQSPLHHYAFDSIADQIHTNLNFAQLGARELLARGKNPGMLKMLFKPLGKFLETYVLKQGFRDGLAGFIIAVNAAHSMFLKYAFCFEETLRKNANSSH